MKRPLHLLLALFLLLAVAADAAPVFPQLTGRVVDTAHLLSAEQVRQLSEHLAAHEKATTDQVVVVTLTDLGGYDIADYGYQLGRHWGIGQKDVDNGVLLIVAPKERRVRIEVGYGLESVLTDYRANEIIQNTILPRFKKNDYSGGIMKGTDAILAVLNGDKSASVKPSQRSSRDITSSPGVIIFIVLFFLFGFSDIFGKAGTLRRVKFAAGLGILVGLITWGTSGDVILSFMVGGMLFIMFMADSSGSITGSGGGSFSSSSSGGSSGGGFSGGGGSFGGGGASGGW